MNHPQLVICPLLSAMHTEASKNFELSIHHLIRIYTSSMLPLAQTISILLLLILGLMWRVLIQSSQ